MLFSSCVCTVDCYSFLYCGSFISKYAIPHRVSFRGGRGGAFAPPRLTLAPPWNWQICMLREPCPPTKLHIAVLPPLSPTPERNTAAHHEPYSLVVDCFAYCLCENGLLMVLLHVRYPLETKGVCVSTGNLLTI